MRNLKRALSLALATVMTMGLMMVGTGASYKDVKTSDNVEAIEVLQTVGIMTGDENGNFNPDKTVTRNEMAVIMANLLNLDYDYYRGTNPFTDVPSWAAPYVAACAAEGVVSGIGNNMYGGEGNVTAAQASLMIMKALGYFQYQADFGDDWQIATIRQASYIDMFAGINANAETALTRNQIAQLVLNGLKAKMVTFTGDVGTEATIGNTSINIGYRAEYTPKTSAAAKYNSIDLGTTNIAENDQYYIQLGEELYNGDLKLKNDTDVFGRPARYWEYDGKEIGTYAKFDQMVKEYTTEVTGKDLYDVLTASTIKDYDLTVYIDGTSDSKINTAIFGAADINKNNKDGVGETGNGVLTQVFVDNEKKDITITIINTYLAFADKDYDAKKDELDITAHGLKKVTGESEYIKYTAAGEDKVGFTLDGEDFDIADIAEDDALLVTVADGEVQTLASAEVLSEVEISAFKVGSNITVDGTKYSYADSAEYKDGDLDVYTTSGVNGTINLKDLTYNVYLDQYGYAIGVEEVEAADNYLFITGIDQNSSNLINKTASANVIFLDGTTKVVDVNLAKSDITLASNPALQNTWCTYTVDKDGVYSVAQVETKIQDGNKVAQNHQTTDNASTGSSALLIDKKNIALDATSGDQYSVVYNNDKTVFLTVELAELVKDDTAYGIISDVASVTTGIKNANLVVWNETEAVAQAEDDKNNFDIAASGATSEGVYTLYKNNGTVIAAVVVGEDSAATKNLVYVHTGSVEQEGYDKTTGEWTWTRKVVSNGEEITLTEVSDSLTYLGNMDQYKWYQVKYNAQGQVIDADQVNGTGVLTDGSDYENDYENINDTVKNGKDTVLYYSEDGINSTLKLINNTLFVANDDVKGFYVSDDVKVVLQQWNKNKLDTFFESGVNSLEDIIDELNERYNGSTYSYYVSAILESGMATTVIIYDNNNNYQKPETSTPAGLPAASVSTSSMEVTVPVVFGKTDNVVDLAIAALEKAGYTVEGIKLDSGEFDLTASKGSVKGYQFKTKTVEYSEVTFAMAGGASNITGKQYVANDDVVTVTIGGKNSGGQAFNWAGYTVEADAHATVSNEKRSTDNSVLTFDATITGLDSAKTTITFSVKSVG